MMGTYAGQASSDSVEEIAAGRPDEPQSLSLDERFEILKNERRRIVLRYLKEVGGTVRLNNLADRVTAIENDIEVEAITSDERKRVYVGLYQFHLPKMAKIGIIEYDQNRGTITLTETGESLSWEYGTEDEPEQESTRLHLAAVTLGVIGIIGSILIQSWPASTVFLGIQTALLIVLWFGWE